MGFSTKSKKYKKSLATLIATSLVLSTFSFLSAIYTPVSAAAVAVTATPNEVTTGGDITFTYTASNAVENTGTTYTFLVYPALSSPVADCGSPDTQADATSGGAGSFGTFTTTGAIFTTTNATTTTGRSFCLSFPNESIGSYSVSIISSTGDFGAALVHYDDNNDVNVTAIIGPSLSFNIRDLTDAADTNVCDLGSVETTTTVDLDSTDDGVGECGYALAIGTNSSSGFQATIDSNGALTNGSHNMTAVDDNGTFSGEEYGLANVTAGVGITENNTVSYTYQTDASPIPTTPNNFVSSTGAVVYTAGSGATDTTLVIHGLTIDSSTPTGSYTQLITYQVTAGF